MKDGEYDFKGLNEFLQYVKAKYPDTLNASVLLEQDIPYDVLVQTMDNVRLYEMDDAPLTGAAAAAAAAPAGGKK